MDAYPSHLLPGTGDAKSALKRARINFFVDTWSTKVQSLWWQVWLADEGEKQETAATALVNAVSKEIEPLLADAAPFFGGSDKLTLAEVRNRSDYLRTQS